MKEVLLFILCISLVKAHLDLQGTHNEDDYVENVVRQAVLSNVIDSLRNSEGESDSNFVDQLYRDEYLQQDDLENMEDVPSYLKSMFRAYKHKHLPRWLKELLKKWKKTCPIPKPCKITVQPEMRKACMEQRQKDIFLARLWYQITDETKPSTILFPFKNIPWLNQTISNMQYYYAIDPFESRYLSLFGVWVKAIGTIRKTVEKAFKDFNFFVYPEYKAIYDAFEKAIAALKAPQYFESYTDDPTYSDELIKDDKWQNDDIFVQFLMSGNCPWLIRKVTESGTVGLKASTLKAQMNSKFQWDDAVAKANGKILTLNKAISDGRLFVLYHEDHNGLESQPDILDKNASDTRTMMNVTSPITLFVLNEKKELKIVAIQWDYTPESEVFTPESSINSWLLAKGMVSQSHGNICQFKYHLGHMHYSGSVFCLAFRRHFTTLHPLYDVLKYHCEGTIPHITQAYGILGFPQSFGHKIYAISHIGINKLSVEAYTERNYGAFNYPELIKSKGLESGQMEYNPFADDGQMIWNAIVKYAKDIVKLYYEDDDDVADDKELQSYADEVSEDGKNGAGKFRGFPASFTSRHQLVEFLTTLMWRPVMHATVNYNLAPTFMPITPSKLYKDTQSDSYGHSLPNADVTVYFTHISNILAHFRANRLLDYHDKVRDPALQRIAWKAYNNLQVCINKKLAERNKERSKKSQLGAQYLMPKYLTTSIHI